MAYFDNIIIYLRKSRSDDPAQTVEEVLAKHERILQDYCIKEYGKIIPEKRIYREVVSGETIQDRPVMQKLLKELETGNISGVLIVEPQRLSRGDLQDCGQIINSFRYTNTAVITPGKTYNLQDEYDRKFFEMELTRGNDYLEYTKKILNRGRVASVKQGNYICSVRPYGYKKVVIGTGKDKCHTLEIIPEEAEAIKLMYHLYLDENMGFTNIARTLDSMHIKPLKSSNWSAATIRDMIDNPIYIGKIVWNNRKVVKKWENEQIIKVRPRNKGDDVICVDGKHQAIIDEETFNAARQKRGLTPKVRKFKELRNPLAGLLFCSTCGHSMSMKKYIDKKYARKVKNPRLGGIICIEKFYNKGATLNLLAKHPKAMTAIHSVIMAFVAVVYYFAMRMTGKKLTKTGLAMLAGGGLSNLYDRYTKHHVVDYVRFQTGPKWFRRIIFNVSDFFIFIGAVLAVIGSEA